MEVVIKLQMPSETKYKSKSIEEKIKECIECVESGYDSPVEWKLLNRTLAKLRKMKRTPRVKNLIAMIEPIMSKHGYHGVVDKESI